MTVIAAWVDLDGGVHMGGDSAAVSNWDLDLVARPKVFAFGEMVIGYTTSFRMGQLIEHKLQLPSDIPDDFEALDRWMAIEFSESVRCVLRDAGYLKSDNGRESMGAFIIGLRGRLYTMDDDLHVRRTLNRFLSCGCGGPIASGAMHAFAGGFAPTDGRIVVGAALRAAEALSIGCRGPFTIISTPKS